MKRFAALSAVAMLAACSQPQAPKAEHAPETPLYTVTNRSVDRTVELSGRIGSATGARQRLQFSMPGRVGSVYVRIGDHVNSGESLASLDTTSLSLAATQAAADARAASANAAQANVDRVSTRLAVDRAALSRAQRLYAAGVNAKKDVEAAQATLSADVADSAAARDQRAASQAQAQSAAAHAASASNDLALATLRAPRDGVVSAVSVAPGDVVDATTVAIVLSPSASSSATLDVPVDRLGDLAIGERVHAKAGSASWDGRITGVATSVDPTTGLGVATVSGVPTALPAGTPIQASVVVNASAGIAIPSSAIVEDPQTGKRLVFVAGKNKDGDTTFSSRDITIDENTANGAMVRVVSGLRAGERIAKSGAVDLLAPSGGGD